VEMSGHIHFPASLDPGKKTAFSPLNISLKICVNLLKNLFSMPGIELCL